MSEPRHIVCPHCLAVNRVPGSRLADAPKCGKCHRALFDGKPHDVSGDAFHTHISRNDIPVVVDFWAAWCGPCRMMEPEFERAAASLAPDFRLLKLDTEADQEIAARLGIRSIPTMVMFANGREIARQPGAMRAADIERWVRTRAPSGAAA